MGTTKRERQKANREAKLAAEAALAARRKRRQTLIYLAVLVAVIIVAGLVLSSCGSSDSDGASKTDTDATSEESTTTAPSDDQTTTAPATEAEYGTGACAPAEGTDQPVLTFDAAPKQCIDPSKTYTATFETSEGDVTVELDTTRTPITTNNFVNLARSGYYDDTTIFRTDSQSGLWQGGSPHTQDNSDPGPGYTIPDEGGTFTSDDYAPGALAMARTGAPNSAGGQFFFVTDEVARYLGDPAQPGAGTYVVFGQTAEGLDVLQAITQLDGGGGVPRTNITVDKVTITES